MAHRIPRRAEAHFTSRSAFEGERKQVTVLFADLKGSMELFADRDPEEARHILDPVLEHMMEAVHQYEGTVNQVLGDGIMALFGAPLAQEDHAIRACHAALRMQATIKQYAEELPGGVGLVVQIRVGLNSGDVVVRSIGSDLRIDYTAVGQTTHLAARMEQLATPGSILVAPNTARLVEGRFQLQPLGPVPVKGLSEPVAVYELLAAGPSRTRLQIAATRGLTRFVGRDAEMKTLARACARARAGHGQVVSVIGEPGAGKSRLVWEFTRSRRAADWLSLRGACVSYGGATPSLPGGATPYLPVIELLTGLFGNEGRTEPGRVRARVAGQLQELDRGLESALPSVLALLDAPVDDPTWTAFDRLDRRNNILDAVRRVLLRQSQARPLILTVENLQWVDAESQALLDSLIADVATARILLILIYRPEYCQRWSSSPHDTRLDVLPLTPESAEELLADLLGTDASLDALKRLLIGRMEGTPLFLEECVRALIENKALVGERGAYRLGASLLDIRIPATVQPILAARIDRLPDLEKELVQAAAVIGQHVSLAVLQHVADQPAGTLPTTLSALQGAELLYETHGFPQREYTFKHELTREVVYGSLVAERRHTLHARAVEVLAVLYAERTGEIVEQLVHHAVQGEVWDKAVGYLQQAGTKANARAANREAVAFHEQALAILERLPADARRREQTIDVLLDLRAPLLQLGRIEEALVRSQEAERLARQLGDQPRLAKVYSYLINYYYLQGEPELAIAYGERCLAMGEASHDVALQVLARRYMGHSYHAQGQYRLAEEILRQNVAVLGSASATEDPATSLTYVASCAWLAFTLAELGQFTEAFHYAEQAQRVATASEHHYSRTIAGTLTGLIWLRCGQPVQALLLLEQSLAECRTQQLTIWQPIPAALLGLTLVHLGRFAEGVALLEEGVAGSQALGIRAYLALWTVHFAEGLFAAGEPARAREVARDGLGLAIRCKELGHQAQALHLLGEIAARDDPPAVDEAEERYRQALALAEALGMRPLIAQCHRGLGALYEGAGRQEQASAEIAAAAETYCAMGPSAWPAGTGEAVIRGALPPALPPAGQGG